MKFPVKFNLAIIIATACILMSWGYTGHYKINYQSMLSFNPEMAQFQSWAALLAEHASDADDRKDTDPSEGPRHYIDIDNYPEFISSGRIQQTYDSVVALYGAGFVLDQGILPWATLRTYDSLVSCFARFDWEKAVLFASDLGHYVGDAHNPLHITRNYNGQYTGNVNIHSRYETGMINAFQGEITMQGGEISVIDDVSEYIFGYIYSNYIYVDSIMAADDYAQGVAGNTSSYQYKAALWEKCRSFTIPLFNHASQALAELIYTAWVQAGRPDMNSGPGIFENNKDTEDLNLQIIPNPVKESASIRFCLKENTGLKMRLIRPDGKAVKTSETEKIPAGVHEISFNMTDLPDGIYFLYVDAGYIIGITKLIKY